MQKYFFVFVFQSCCGVDLMTKISLLCSIFYQGLRNLGNMAKIFLHALSISEKYNMIVFNFGGFCRRMALMVSCYMLLRHSMVLTGVSLLSKWQAIKPFHIGIKLRQGCALFPLFFILYMSWIDKCNQVDEFATIGI